MIQIRWAVSAAIALTFATPVCAGAGEQKNRWDRAADLFLSDVADIKALRATYYCDTGYDQGQEYGPCLGSDNSGSGPLLSARQTDAILEGADAAAKRLRHGDGKPALALLRALLHLNAPARADTTDNFKAYPRRELRWQAKQDLIGWGYKDPPSGRGRGK